MPTVMLITVNTAHVQPWEPRGLLLTSMCRAPAPGCTDTRTRRRTPGAGLPSAHCTEEQTKVRRAHISPRVQSQEGVLGAFTPRAQICTTKPASPAALLGEEALGTPPPRTESPPAQKDPARGLTAHARAMCD